MPGHVCCLANDVPAFVMPPAATFTTGDLLVASVAAAIGTGILSVRRDTPNNLTLLSESGEQPITQVVIN